MAARSVSPGAALLRTSRMFSMPAPIPAAPGDYSSATKHQSATATIPYPTHLTITTPSTSRIAGDWGLKRHLPLKKTTKQTYPLVRILQVDSTEHVTDFRTASDHTMTLKKFQELNLPISVPSEDIIRRPKSVFEEDGDITAIENAEQALATENKRWKFKGPWLAGMTDGEFNKWLDKNVRTKRAEFRAYLRDVYAKELTGGQRAAALRANLPVPPEVRASDITEAQLVEYLKDIRTDRLVLFRLVSRFLDLAPLTTDYEFLPSMKPFRPQEFNRGNPYGVDGPPITHPSAGLSYLRTPNFMDNHPIYGPQKYHPVVKARVLKPRNSATGVHDPVIGIAGIVADTALEQRNLGSAGSLRSSRGQALAQLDYTNFGGSKLYYKLDSATIDSNGKIRLKVSEPNPNTQMVVKEMLGETAEKYEVYNKSMQSNTQEDTTHMPRGNGLQRRSQIYGSKESYGLGFHKA